MSEGITPGKWSVIISRDVYSAVIAEGIATVCMNVENDHDANLIAASKDLLAACIRGVEDRQCAIKCDGPHNDCHCWYCETSAAISKALGSPAK